MDVLAQDEKELFSLGGTFENIADRMMDIIEAAKAAKAFPYEFDEKVSILTYFLTRGEQPCPFDESCLIGDYAGWNDDIRIESKITGKELMINSGTAHLVREHHLLEKDNIYGISAEEFYKGFM